MSSTYFSGACATTTAKPNQRSEYNNHTSTLPRRGYRGFVIRCTTTTTIAIVSAVGAVDRGVDLDFEVVALIDGCSNTNGGGDEHADGGELHLEDFLVYHLKECV